MKIEVANKLIRQQLNRLAIKEKDRAGKVVPLDLMMFMNQIGITPLEHKRFLNSNDLERSTEYRRLCNTVEEYNVSLGITRLINNDRNPLGMAKGLQLIHERLTKTREISPDEKMFRLLPNIVPEFSYLFALIQNIHYKQTPFIREVNLCGPRKSGKTWTIALFILALLMSPVSVKVIYVRHLVKDSVESYDDISNRCKEFFPDADWKYHKNKKLITHNQNELRVIGLKDKSKAKGVSQSQLGLKAITAEYGILFIDEANQVDDDLMNAVKEAVRGCKHLIMFRASNPWTINNDYISYCNDNLRFDENQMKTRHQQLFIDKVAGKIFHYVGWQLNPHLSHFETQYLKDILIDNPVRGRVVSLGMPGHTQGSIYGDELPYLVPFDENNFDWTEIGELFGGIDIGGTKAASVATLIGLSINRDKVYIISHWCWDNKNKKGMLLNHQLKEMVAFFGRLEGIPAMYQERFRGKMIEIFVDYGSQGAIESLNTYRDELAETYKWVGGHFYGPCMKVEINRRIDWVKVAMGLKKIHFNHHRLKCLYYELENAVWDTDGRNPTRLDEKNDHIDSFEYAIIRFMRDILQGHSLSLQNF